MLGLSASATAAFGWGLAAIFARLASAPALVLTFYRMWLGAALLCLVSLLSGRRLSWHTVRVSAMGGILLCGDMAMFFGAIKLTSIAAATVIAAMSPPLVVIGARALFNERMSRSGLAWAVLAIAGVTTVIVGSGTLSHQELLGDLLAIGSLVAFSGYWLASKHARARLGAVEYTASTTLVAALVLTPLVLVSGQSLGRVTSIDWLWFGLLAVVPGGAHLLMNWAHRFVDASVSSVITVGNPVVAAAAAFFVFGQRLTAIQVVGGLVALAAIAVVAFKRGKPVESPIE